jgi:hypothetical protein
VPSRQHQDISYSQYFRGTLFQIVHCHYFHSVGPRFCLRYRTRISRPGSTLPVTASGVQKCPFIILLIIGKFHPTTELATFSRHDEIVCTLPTRRMDNAGSSEPFSFHWATLHWSSKWIVQESVLISRGLVCEPCTAPERKLAILPFDHTYS